MGAMIANYLMGIVALVVFGKVGHLFITDARVEDYLPVSICGAVLLFTAYVVKTVFGF